MVAVNSSTQDFIQGTLAILLIGGFFFMIFGGLGYLIYKTETQQERVYVKCIDTCERVFQEQKLIDCISTCNQMSEKNETQARGR